MLAPFSVVALPHVRKQTMTGSNLCSCFFGLFSQHLFYQNSTKGYERSRLSSLRSKFGMILSLDHGRLQVLQPTIWLEFSIIVPHAQPQLRDPCVGVALKLGHRQLKRETLARSCRLENRLAGMTAGTLGSPKGSSGFRAGGWVLGLRILGVLGFRV